MKSLLPGIIYLGVLLTSTELRGVEIGLFNPYITTGARVSPETLVPAVRKWYLPQTLYTLYDWKGYEYTNYARQIYRRYVDTEYEDARLPFLYHHYAGHDNNRDFFQANLVETRYWMALMFHTAFPQLYLDQHQMGNNGPRIFVPLALCA